MTKRKQQVITTIIVSLVLLGIILVGNVGALELNPSKGQPVFLGDPANPSTYTSTPNNPLPTRVERGSVTVINKTLWEALPDVIYTTFDVVTTSYGTYSYIGTFTPISGFIYTIEYIIITKNGTELVDYYNFNVFTDTNFDKLILGAEVSPASGMSIFKTPTPMVLKDNKYKFLLQNKASSGQNFKIGIVVGSHKTN